MNLTEKINIEDFISGSLRQSINYKYFLPNIINKDWFWTDSKINILLEKASFELGQLNSYALLVPNIDIFIHLHITKESVISNKIEGTQTQFDEAFLSEENISAERKDDWLEVQNYTNALNTAIDNLKELPISSRVLLNTHRLLMSGVRGEKKTPGEYRKSQNWVSGGSLNDAVFIPPHQDHLNELIGDLEKFIHNDNLEIPILIKAAIIHYQFETIHPFLDGNGRIGRLLITLFLIEKKILIKPLLYLSRYFEADKNLYYNNLTKVRTQNDIKQWIKYFLVGVAETSAKSVETLKKVIEIKNSNEETIKNEFGKRITSAFILHNYLLIQPVVNIKDVQNQCSLTAKSAGELVRLFEEKGILVEYSGQFRNRMYYYKNYINQFN
jgi:Fic family protein